MDFLDGELSFMEELISSRNNVDTAKAYKEHLERSMDLLSNRIDFNKKRLCDILEIENMKDSIALSKERELLLRVIATYSKHLELYRKTYDAMGPDELQM